MPSEGPMARGTTGRGQSKLHDVELRDETGAVVGTKQVTQTAWKNRATDPDLAGWTRVDGVEEEVAPVTPSVVPPSGSNPDMA